MEAALARPRNAAERRLAVVSHAAGLLGATVAGWALAAAVSIALLSLAGRRRAPYLALQAGQAALYQLAVLAIDLVGVGWLVVGFIAFAGDIPGLPSIRLDDLGEPIWLSLQVVWALTILAWPVWHVLTLVWAGVGAVRTARGGWYWYPVVGRRLKDFLARPRTPDQRPARPLAQPAPSGAEEVTRANGEDAER